MPEAPSLYRRHRPRTFDQVVGQEHVVRTLRNAVAQGKVHHAHLFVGSRGTGKTSMAKILAACLNCEQGPTVEPCGVCASCRAIASATSLDVIEMDAASNNSVDDIRDLRERVAYAPVSGRHKVYILDEAHMLSTQAWNAFLKTLEEPPPNTIFVLATTEAGKVLPTVVDRCHRFDFARPTVDQIASVLRRVAEAEGIVISPEAVALIARHATGSFRDALGTLEQLVTYAGAGPGTPGGEGTGVSTEIATEDVLAVLGVADADLLFDALDAVARGDARSALLATAQLARTGRDALGFVGDLEGHARDLMVVQTLGEVPPELAVTPERDERLREQAGRVGPAAVARLLDLLAGAMESTRNGSDAQTQLELALVKAAAPDVDPSTQALLARIERLEAALGRAGSAAPGAAAPAGPGAEAPAPRAEAPAPRAEAPAPRAEAPAPRAEMPTPPTEPAPGPESPVPPGAPSPEAPVPPSTPPPPDPPSQPAVAPPPNGNATAIAVAADAPPAPAVTGLPLDLAGLRALWPAVLDTLKQTNALCAALLADAQPVAVSGEEVTVAFPASAGFLRRKAEDETYRACVTAAIRTVTGERARVAYTVRDAEPGSDPAPPAAGPTEEEWVARFVAEFDAEEIAPEPESPSQSPSESEAS